MAKTEGLLQILSPYRSAGALLSHPGGIDVLCDTDPLKTVELYSYSYSVNAVATVPLAVWL